MSNLRFRTRLAVSLVAAGIAGYFTLRDVKPVSEGLRIEKANAESFLSDLEQKRLEARVRFVSRGGKPDYWIARGMVNLTLTSKESADIDAFKTCSTLESGIFPPGILEDVQNRAKNGHPLEITVERTGQQMSDALKKAYCPSSKDAMARAEQVNTTFLKRVSDAENDIVQRELTARVSISAYNKDNARYTGELLTAAIGTTLAGLFAFFASTPIFRFASSFRRRRNEEDVTAKVPEHVHADIRPAPSETQPAMAIPLSASGASRIKTTQRMKGEPRPPRDPTERGTEAIAMVFGELHATGLAAIARAIDPDVIIKIGASRDPGQTARIWFEKNHTRFEQNVGEWFAAVLSSQRKT